MVTSGYHFEAAVRGVGFGDGDPEGGDVHGFQGPECSVLMPEYRASGSGGLADVVGGEEGDIAADEDLRDIEKPLIAHEAQPEGVVPGQIEVEFIRFEAGVLFQQPVHVVEGFVCQGLIENTAKDDVTVFLVALKDIVSFGGFHGYDSL